MEILKKLESQINGHYADYKPTGIVLEIVGAFALMYGIRLLSNEDFRNAVVQKLFKSLKALPGVQGQIEKEKSKIRKLLHDKFEIKDQEKFLKLPEKGLSKEQILKLMKQMKEKEDAYWKSGKISGGVYIADESHIDLMNQAYSMYSMSNPLHPDIWPSVRKYEVEIIRMTADMLNGDETIVGTVTSGGTESILMAVKTYRDKFQFSHPEMVIPITAHAAFDKAAAYFGIKAIHIPVDPKTMQVDVKAVERAITKNTIMLVGSAPNYPYGCIDPIEELASIAEKRGIGMHVDSCLGGFFLPWIKKAGFKIPNFDFSISGVTSISADTHKYGYTTKGTSVIMFRGEELRRFMYFVQPNWPGGVYSSPAIAGTKPGGLIACAWAALLKMGKDGYMAKAKEIYETAQQIKAGINKIPALHIVGESHSSVVAFGSKNFDIYKLGEALGKRGWNLNNLQNPNCIHVCVTAPMAKLLDIFLKDLKECTEYVEQNPTAFSDGLAPVYGLASSFPDRAVIADVGKAFLDAVLS